MTGPGTRAAAGRTRAPRGRPRHTAGMANERWHAFFPRFYRALRLLDPAISRWWSRFGVGNTVVFEVPGRRSGRPRHVFLGLLTVRGVPYLGHPDGACAWTLNVDAAGRGRVLRHDRPAEDVRTVKLPHGPEREAVIRATFRQHPFPGNVIYWLAKHHVRATGTYYRLEPPQRNDPAAGRR